MAELLWDVGDKNGTGLLDWLDGVADVDGAIRKLEAAAGAKGDWELNDFGAMDWWGLHGTFKGAVFTVYTHKSGVIKIGGDGFFGNHDLDVPGLKAALLAIINA